MAGALVVGLLSVERDRTLVLEILICVVVGRRELGAVLGVAVALAHICDVVVAGLVALIETGPQQEGGGERGDEADMGHGHLLRVGGVTRARCRGVPMNRADPEGRTAPAVLIVTGADTPLGGAVVEEARGAGLPVLACGADHGALMAIAGEAVVALTLRGVEPDQHRVLLAVAEDRFGGVSGVVHAEGFGGVPGSAASLGSRLDSIRALCSALPPTTPQVLVLEESGRRGDPDAPLRAAAAAAIAAWSRSLAPAPRIVWVPVDASAVAWAAPLLRAVRPVGLRGRVADSARRLVRRRG